MKMALEYVAGQLGLMGRGEADGLDKSLFDREVLRAIRYADPAAWAAATAVARACEGIGERIASVRDRVGVVVICEQGPVETIAALAEAAREGYTSALRYPAANPGSLAGVSCIAFGFRGPTLSLLVNPSDGVPLGLFMARRWLARMEDGLVALAVCTRVEPSRHLARAAMVSAAGAAANVDTDTVTWLTGVPGTVDTA